MKSDFRKKDLPTGRQASLPARQAYYLTTTLPYVNDRPHIGHALEFVQADVVARYKRLQGYDVILNFGTDEHGQKIYKKALESGKEPQAYVDEYAATFDELKQVLNFSFDNFIRTTDPAHKEAAREFWRICLKHDDIYKQAYKVKYCVGCELEKTDSELTNNICPLHPNREIEVRDEENYFFRLSKYTEALSKLYEERPDFVIPAFRLNEIKTLIKEEGLKDFSISRLKEKMPWGIPVPDDESHIMYVWFDALINYISTIGWPKDMDTFKKYWVDTGGVVQFAGKDQVRQQAAMWQAMLMSANLPPSKQIIIHGFIVGEGGIKMSKSLGNGVDPFEVVKEYGTDALRYFLLRHIHPFEDSEFTMDKFKEAYNADLVNGLGNLVSRVMRMFVDAKLELHEEEKRKINEEFFKELDHGNFYTNGFDNYNLNHSMDYIWDIIKSVDKVITDNQPFKLIKSDNSKDKERAVKDILFAVAQLDFIAMLLEPLLPETSGKIKDLINNHKFPETPLFPRK